MIILVMLQGTPHGVGATVAQVLFARGCGSGTEASPLALTVAGNNVCRQAFDPTPFGEACMFLSLRLSQSL